RRFRRRTRRGHLRGQRPVGAGHFRLRMGQRPGQLRHMSRQPRPGHTVGELAPLLRRRPYPVRRGGTPLLLLHPDLGGIGGRDRPADGHWYRDRCQRGELERGLPGRSGDREHRAIRRHLLRRGRLARPLVGTAHRIGGRRPGQRDIRRVRLRRMSRHSSSDLRSVVLMTEFIVHVENRPGTLATITELLGSSGVNIEALAAYGYDGEGVLRLIVDDAATTRRILAEAGFRVEEHTVLTAFMPHAPGALASVTRQLAEADVNIDALYVLSTSAEGIEVAIAVDDNASAVPDLPVTGSISR